MEGIDRRLLAAGKRLLNAALRSLILLVWIFCAIPAAQALPAQVKVELFEAHGALSQVVVEGPVRLLSPQERTLAAPSFVMRASGGTVQIEEASATKSGGASICKSDRLVLEGENGELAIKLGSDQRRAYRGTVTATSRAGRLRLVNRVDARDYVRSVVGSEIPPGFALEALKAQSVLTQTWLARMKPHSLVPDTTEQQCYSGQFAVTPEIEQAVDATWDETLYFGGLPALAYFHSTCAGGTSDGEVYFALKSGGFPYLKGRVCNYCRPSPFFKEHRVSIPMAVWLRHFNCQAPSIAQMDERRRPLKVDCHGRQVNGYRFWLEIGQALGFDKVPGTRFQVEHQPGHVVLSSTGAGHGVGLCQWGANGLALAGKSYKEILEYYFPGTDIHKSEKSGK